MALTSIKPVSSNPFFVQYKSTPSATTAAAPSVAAPSANTVSLAQISASNTGPQLPSNLTTTANATPISNVGTNTSKNATSAPVLTGKAAEVSKYNAPLGAQINTSVVDAVLAKNFDKGDPNLVTGEQLKTAEKKGQIDPSLGNLLSSSAAVAKGAAALGLTKKEVPVGMTGKKENYYGGDFEAAAKALRIDLTPYQKTVSGAMGSKQTVLDKPAVYNAINDAANQAGFYAITERQVGSTGSAKNATHTTTLYTNQGGTLQPFTDAQGNPVTSSFKSNTYVSDPGFFGGLVEGLSSIASEMSPILIAMGVGNGLSYIMNGIANAGVGTATLDAASKAGASLSGGNGISLTSGLTLPSGATTAGTASLSAGGGVLAPNLGASLGAGGTAIGAGSVGLSSLFPSGLTAGTASLFPTMVNAADLLYPGLTAGAGGISLSDLQNIPTNIPGGVGDVDQMPSNDELPSGDMGLPPFDEGGLPDLGGITGGANGIIDQIQQATGLSVADARSLLNSAINKSSLASILGSAGQGAASIYAADKQYEAAKYAADLQKQMFDIINSQYAPQRGAGYQALGQIRSMLPGQFTRYDETGKPIGTATGTDYLTRQFTPQDLYAGLAPNYNFMLQQGQQAAQRQGNVSGGGLGGNVQRALQEYTQNYAGNAYQNAFQNFQNQRTNIYNTLAGIAGLGQQAQGTTAQAGQNMATNVGQLAVGGAGAQAAGITGAANAIAGGAQNYGANQILQAILGQNQNVAQGGGVATPPFNAA